MKPWILWQLLRAFTIWPWRLLLLLWHGPGHFCWDFSCWERPWANCRAGYVDNGPCCETHCREKSYHRSCAPAAKTVINIRGGQLGARP